jgi:hypothetical protein
MILRRILVALVVLAVAGILGWHLTDRPEKPAIVVRYLEPPARGTGRLGLISCGLRVEDRAGKAIVLREMPAKAVGGAVRTVRIELTPGQIAQAQRVLAACTDAAGRTGESTSYALGPIREPLTRVAIQE